MAAATFHPSLTIGHPALGSRSSLLKRFFGWCSDQQFNRLLWLGIALVVHGAVLVPVTLLAGMVGGNQFMSVIISVISMAMVVVTNLAAMPTKITIPVLFLSVLVDIGVILIDIFNGLV